MTDAPKDSPSPASVVHRKEVIASVPEQAEGPRDRVRMSGVPVVGPASVVGGQADVPIPDSLCKLCGHYMGEFNQEHGDRSDVGVPSGRLVRCTGCKVCRVWGDAPKAPEPDWVDLAAEWLDCYDDGKDFREDAAECKAVAEFLRAEADRRERAAVVREVVRKTGKPPSAVRAAMRAAEGK